MKRADIIANVSFACPICKNSFKEAADALQCRNSHVAPTEIVESKFGSRELPDIIAVKFPGGYVGLYEIRYRDSQRADYRKYMKEKAAQESDWERNPLN